MADEVGERPGSVPEAGGDTTVVVAGRRLLSDLESLEDLIGHVRGVWALSPENSKESREWLAQCWRVVVESLERNGALMEEALVQAGWPPWSSLKALRRVI